MLTHVSVPLRGNVNNDNKKHLLSNHFNRVSVPLRGNVNNDSESCGRWWTQKLSVSVPLRGNVNNDPSGTLNSQTAFLGFRPLTGKCK